MLIVRLIIKYNSYLEIAMTRLSIFYQKVPIKFLIETRFLVLRYSQIKEKLT